MAAATRFYGMRFLIGMGLLLVGDAMAVPVVCVHQSGCVRVFYHVTGTHAVDPADENGNGIPDQVEDALTQTLAARRLWVDVLGFPDPLESVRYRKAKFLDIHFRARDALKSNGKAFDEMQPTRHAGEPAGTLRIGFHLATSVKPAANLTPAHEYFHLIQYASTYFKNRWFIEGTARWSERGLGAGGLGPVRELAVWPLPPEKRDLHYQRADDAAEHLWNPLSKMMDSDGEIPECAALRKLQEMRYANGAVVLQDLRLTGWRFIRDVLCEMGRQDVMAFHELGYEKWSEENQKSTRNDRYLLRAVETVVESKSGRAR